MDGTQFNISVVTGGSGAAIDSIVSGIESIANHLNTLNRNFVSASQQNVAALNNIAAGAGRTENAISKVGNAVFHLNQIQQALSGVKSDLDSAVEPGIKLNSSLTDLQAITNVTDRQLDKLGTSARKNALDFGISAAGGVESYKIFLSKLGPELANSEKGLSSMGVNATVLSKQLKGDVAGATGILTTAMNQYAVSTKDPIEASKTMATMMNIMSAGAQEGSAELPEIASALEQSGMMAKTANVSFAELNASIQVLDKAGKKGAEGGVAIRNVLAELSQGKMMPRQQLELLKAAGINVEALADKSKSFADRLRLLTPIVNDNAAMVKLFGKENVAAGIAAVKGADEIERMTKKVNGTNSAFDMAKITMGSYEEKMNRVKARIEDFGISIFNAAKPVMPFITIGMGAIQVMANMAQASTLFSVIAKSRFVAAIGAGIVSMGSWIATTTAATLAQLGLNAAMYANPIGLVVLAVVAAIAAVAALIHWWDNIWNTIKAFGVWIFEHNPFRFLIDVVSVVFPGFKHAMGQLWDWIVGKFEVLVGWIKKAWGWIKSLFGGDETKEATKAAVEDMAKQVKDVKIDGITVQGVADKSSALGDYDPHKKKDKKGHELASNITSGGSRPTTIHMTIQKVIGIGEVKTTNFMGTVKEAGKQAVEELLMALQSVNGKVSTE